MKLGKIIKCLNYLISKISSGPCNVSKFKTQPSMPNLPNWANTLNNIIHETGSLDNTASGINAVMIPIPVANFSKANKL